jgi:hypothetical protein
MPILTPLAAASLKAWGFLAAAGVGVAVDPYFNYTTLLLHGDGTNGAQNNTFLDSSTNNFTITRNGNTTQGTFSPFSQTGWSNYFDGDNDNLSIADNAALDFGTGTVTIEAWIFMTGNANAYRMIVQKYLNPSGYELYVSNANKLEAFLTGTTITSTSTLSLNTWYHVAVVRSGTGTNQTKLYINGVEEGTATSTGNLDNSNSLFIGTSSGNTNDFAGYISNVRINNTAVYSSAFTPSTTPLTAISGTSLLTCQSNRFVDNSSNAFAITVNGNTSVQAFSPFAPTAAYSAATVGGSGYFDGSGDYLSVADNAAFTAPSDFTVEFWAYTSSVASNPVFYLINATNGLIVYVTSSKVVIRSFGVADLLTSNINMPLNQWVHIAAARSGTTMSLWINGFRTDGGTVTNSTSFAQGELRIGSNESATQSVTGYISNVRFVKGTAVYDPTSSTIAVPTAPLTAITNTSLLLNFTNAGIIDNTAKNVLETVGNAQISTSVKKYGTGSMAFDGNGDNLSGPANPNLDMNTGNWTIECWVYVSSRTLNYPLIFGNNNGSYSAGALAITNSNADSASYNDKFVLAAYDVASPTLVASSTNSLNTWYHLALVRNGTSLVMYRDGTSVASTTISSSVVFDWGKLGFKVGGGNWDGAQSYFNGYIDDLRITKGVARYTSAFTPPTEAFPDL